MRARGIECTRGASRGPHSHSRGRGGAQSARGGFAQFFSGAHGRGEAGCSEPSPRSSFSACAIRRVACRKCSATRRSTSTSARLHKSRHVGPGAGARWDGIRKLPRIAGRKQPPAPLSTLCKHCKHYKLASRERGIVSLPTPSEPPPPSPPSSLPPRGPPSQPSSVRARPQPPRGSSVVASFNVSFTGNQELSRGVRQTKTESPSGSISTTTPLSLRGGSRPRRAGARPSSRASTRRSRNPASRPRSRGRSGRGGRPCPRGTRRP